MLGTVQRVFSRMVRLGTLQLKRTKRPLFDGFGGLTKSTQVNYLNYMQNQGLGAGIIFNQL